MERLALETTWVIDKGEEGEMGGEKKSFPVVTVIQFSSYLKIFFLIKKTKNLLVKTFCKNDMR